MTNWRKDGMADLARQGFMKPAKTRYRTIFEVMIDGVVVERNERKPYAQQHVKEWFKPLHPKATIKVIPFKQEQVNGQWWPHRDMGAVKAA